MAPGSRSRTPSLRRQSQPVYPLPMIIEDVAAVSTTGTDPPTLPERSPRRARPASVPVLPSQYGGGAGGLMRNNSTGSMASIRAASERGLSSSQRNSKVGGGLAGQNGVVKSEAPRRQDPERHRIMDRMAKRGGWYKLVLLSILVVGTFIGLGVGLTLGLRKRNDRAPPPALPVDLFPAGSYAFTTALTNVSTGCLSSSYPTNVWQCLTGNNIFGSSPPANPEGSSTTYHWIIEPTSPFSYVISSSPPPGDDSSSSLDQGVPSLVPTFTNLSLTLHDANQATERFTFSFTVPKMVKLDIPLTGTSNSSSAKRSASTRNTEIELETRRLSERQEQQEDKTKPITCFFNTTLMSATIWTRMRADFPGNISGVPTPVNASRAGFAPWPFRIEVEEVDSAAAGGSSSNSNSDDVKESGTFVTPDCRDAEGRVVALSELVAAAGGSSDGESNNRGGNSGAVSARAIEDTVLRILKRREFRRRQQGGEAEDKNTDESAVNQCSCRYANYELSASKGAAAKERGGDDEEGSSTTTKSRKAATSEPTSTSSPTAAAQGLPS
ncbi:hypothetical protein V8F20_006470 [Naviculisporaceae sp. PSN 640]